MVNGVIFDIKEFALNDGPGIRLTVFLKGCPLRCKWCHNPEGMSASPQFNNKTNKMVGTTYTSQELIKYITNFRDVFDLSQGGVTFSGGEPTTQSEFLIEVLQGLPNIHKNLDTSGFCEPNIFKNIIKYTDLVFFDIKLVNSEIHKSFTGVSNEIILKNLEMISSSNVPYHIRIPLIPDITDTKENLKDIRNLITTLKNKPIQVDTLAYNSLAGAKYKTYDMEYQLGDWKNQNNWKNIEVFKDKLSEVLC